MTVTAPRWPQGDQSSVVVGARPLRQVCSLSNLSLRCPALSGRMRCCPSGEMAGASLLPYSILRSPRTGRKVGHLAAGSPQAHPSGDTPQLASPRDVSRLLTPL